MTIIPFSYFYHYYYNSHCYIMHFQIDQRTLNITDHQKYILSTVCADVLPTHYFRFTRTCEREKNVTMRFIQTFYPAGGSYCTCHICTWKTVILNISFVRAHECAWQISQPYLIATHAAYGKKNITLLIFTFIFFQRRLIKIIFFPLFFYCRAIRRWIRPAFLCNPFGQVTNSCLILFRTIRLMCLTFS